MTVAAAPAGPAGPAGRADVAAPFRAAAPTDASFRPAPADAADAAAPGRAAALVDVPAPVFYQCCSPTSDGSVSPARPGPSGGRPPGSDGPNQRSSRCWLSRPKLGQAVCPGLLWVLKVHPRRHRATSELRVDTVVGLECLQSRPADHRDPVCQAASAGRACQVANNTATACAGAQDDRDKRARVERLGCRRHSLRPRKHGMGKEEHCQPSSSAASRRTRRERQCGIPL